MYQNKTIFSVLIISTLIFAFNNCSESFQMEIQSLSSELATEECDDCELEEPNVESESELTSELEPEVNEDPISQTPRTSDSKGLLSLIDFEDDFVGSAGEHEHLYISGNSPEIVKAQKEFAPRRGHYMMKTFLDRSAQLAVKNFRTEVALSQPKEFFKGEEYWMGVSIYLPSNWCMDYGEKGTTGLVLQFHGRGYNEPSPGAWRTILPLTVAHTKDGWHIRNHTYANSSGNRGNLKTISKYVPYKLGQWTDFVINVKFSGKTSPNDTDGFTRVWVNGEKVLDQVGQNFYGEQDRGPFFKLGLYNSSWKYPERWDGTCTTRTLYHDELRIGDKNASYEVVAP